MLLHFNDQSSFSAEQLVEYTGIEKEYMLLLLESMIKMKLLKRRDQDKDKLCETSTVEINTAYNEYVFLSYSITKNEVSQEIFSIKQLYVPLFIIYRPKIRIDITAKMESERKAEQKQTHSRIDEDRGHLIEAAIVRIMKMRKRLTQRDLIGEVLSQLTTKFSPKIPHIKVNHQLYLI